MTHHSEPPFGPVLGSSHRRVGGHIRVVVVDDSAIVRRMIVGCLAGMTGIKVVGEAESAAEGIRLATTLRPNVLILDISMPGGSGLDVLTHVKAKTPGVTVIMFSAFQDEQVRERCRELGADHCFLKPDESPALLAVLTQLAQRMGWKDPEAK